MSPGASVYPWLDGTTEPPAASHQHLVAVYDVYDVLVGEPIGALKFYHRLWRREFPDGGTLKELLSTPDVNVDRVRAALEVLRPAVIRGMAADAARPLYSAPIGLLNTYLSP